MAITYASANVGFPVPACLDRSTLCPATAVLTTYFCSSVNLKNRFEVDEAVQLKVNSDLDLNGKTLVDQASSLLHFQHGLLRFFQPIDLPDIRVTSAPLTITEDQDSSSEVFFSLRCFGAPFTMFSKLLACSCFSTFLYPTTADSISRQERLSDFMPQIRRPFQAFENLIPPTGQFGATLLKSLSA